MTTKESANNAIYYPAITKDYVLKNDEQRGYGMYANSNIPKNKLISFHSLEFLFTDVQEGDYLLMDGYEDASKESKIKIPDRIPLTRDQLLRTHGIPVLLPDPMGQTAGIITWRLEVPSMMMNHSCDPTIYNDGKCDGYDRASRDIKKGDEFTWDYCLNFYDKGCMIETCRCGAAKCRGQMLGFKHLNEDEKKRLFSKASTAVQAMYLADIGKGKPVKFEQDSMFVPRIPTSILRMVIPGPSYACSYLELQQDDNTGTMSIYATKDFQFGQRVYEFWRKHWIGGPIVDMVFSSSYGGDLPEGTTIRVDAAECGYKDRNGKYMFSGFDMLTRHSCDPNIMYNEASESEDDDWHWAYAAKDIRKGDLLTIDFNSIFWDRSDVLADDEDGCTCRSTRCTGTVRGFKHLSKEEQEERRFMNWRRVGPAYAGENPETTQTLGLALSHHIRNCWEHKYESAPFFVPVPTGSEDNDSDDS